MKISHDGTRYILKLDVGEEIVSCLKSFMNDEKLASASFTGIGATERAVIGYFDRVKKEYTRKTIDTVCEITSLIGNLAWSESDEPIVHGHITLGFPDYHIEGGHLFEGFIGVVGEILVTPFNNIIVRKKNDNFGLMLMDI